MIQIKTIIVLILIVSLVGFIIWLMGAMPTHQEAIQAPRASIPWVGNEVNIP